MHGKDKSSYPKRISSNLVISLVPYKKKKMKLFLAFLKEYSAIFLSISAKYLQDGNAVTVDANGGLLDSVSPMDFLPGFSLEGYPNRDSTIYGDLYGIREAHTILRGTLRYKGICYRIFGFLGF